MEDWRGDWKGDYPGSMENQMATLNNITWEKLPSGKNVQRQRQNLHTCNNILGLGHKPGAKETVIHSINMLS